MVHILYEQCMDGAYFARVVYDQGFDDLLNRVRIVECKHE